MRVIIGWANIAQIGAGNHDINGLAWRSDGMLIGLLADGHVLLEGVPGLAKSLAVAPFCDIIWMETKTADLDDARIFAEAIHSRFPDKMLAYNLSPSFNWDTTGMIDDQMRQFPKELGTLGFVFNFITYGGHQVDGMAVEDFARALKEDGMLALAKLQRKIRLVESPYRTPQTLVGGPRADAALMASSVCTWSTIFFAATRLFKLDPRFGAVLGTGGAVCGVSGSIAIGGAVNQFC